MKMKSRGALNNDKAVLLEIQLNFIIQTKGKTSKSTFYLQIAFVVVHPSFEPIYSSLRP